MAVTDTSAISGQTDPFGPVPAIRQLTVVQGLTDAEVAALMARFVLMAMALPADARTTGASGVSGRQPASG